MGKFDQNQYDQWHSDPENWVWEMFYFNPKDDRLFPPKRIKEMGWTINFGNPNSVFLFLIILCIIIFLGKTFS